MENPSRLRATGCVRREFGQARFLCVRNGMRRAWSVLEPGQPQTIWCGWKALKRNGCARSSGVDAANRFDWCCDHATRRNCLRQGANCPMLSGIAPSCRSPWRVAHTSISIGESQVDAPPIALMCKRRARFPQTNRPARL